MIPPGEIARLAHQLRLGDKTIEKDYVLSWMLLAIANSPLRDQLAFKGGTAIKKIYEPDYRFSEDLDFTLLGDLPNENLTAAIQALFPWMQREVNITLAVRKVDVHQSGNPAIYINYVGPLRGDLSSRFFKTDFTRDEALLFPLVEAPLQVPYSDCQGRAETLYVYSPEEIMAEKLCALLGRTEPRDLYDVYFMLSNRLVNVEALLPHLDAKMTHKGLDPAALGSVLVRKQSTFSHFWELRLGGQLHDLPSLDKVIRETNRWFRQSGLV